MSRVRVRPGSVSGTVLAPPSKSYTHRALVAAHLAGRAYRVERPLVSDDTLRTASGLLELGSRTERKRRAWKVEPGASPNSRTRSTIDCGESGTTLRLLAAVVAASRTPIRFTGQGRLPARPMGPLIESLRALGADLRPAAASNALPLEIRGPIHGGRVAIDASQSSQFISALLLVLPTVGPDSSLLLQGSIVSVPYIEATLAVLRYHRVRFHRRRATFELPGGQVFGSDRFRVPGDASSAAYLWAAAAVAGGRVTVEGISRRWPQADLAVLDLLRAYGAEVRAAGDRVTVTGGEHLPFRIALTGSPDLYPLAGVLAATANGVSAIEGAPQVAFKESDRRTETLALVRSMGASGALTERALLVRGTARPRGRPRRTFRDHRLVMSAAVGALAADRPVEIGEATAVEKSYPGFWNDLARISEGVRPG